MESLDDLFDEAGVDTNVEIPPPPPKNNQKGKSDGQASSTQKELNLKPSSSTATKVGESRKRKKSDKKHSGGKSPIMPSGSAGENRPETAAKKLKGPAGLIEEVTAEDFAVMAKVARVGAEAFEKMKQAALANTPENLAGMYSETRTYNAWLARRLASVQQILKCARREYVELLKEHRELKAECDKNAGLLNRLVAAEKLAAENKRKAAELDKVSADLEAAREELTRAKKNAENAETKLKEAEQKCQTLKKTSAEAAKLGYTRCLSQVLVLDPEFPVNKVHLSQRVEHGRILSRDGRVLYPEEAEEREAEAAEAAGGQEEIPQADEGQTENAGEN